MQIWPSMAVSMPLNRSSFALLLQASCTMQDTSRNGSFLLIKRPDLAAQVLKDARAVDDRAAAGEDIRPLCGLTVAVKELFDVAGYTAGAGTPALQGWKTPSELCWS